MITFRSMPSLVSTQQTPRGAASGRRWRIATMVASLAMPLAAQAQIPLTHTDDAAPVPRGGIRFTITTGWTHFDERFTASGRRSLGDEISTDSLGPRQLPLLAPVEAGLQALTNDPTTRLTFGRLAAQ